MRSNGSDTVGLRFVDVTVPQGATISNAYLTIYNLGKLHIDPAFLIQCDKQANSPTFAASPPADTPAGRTLTTASYDWTDVSNPNPENPGSWWSSPDISAPIQEVINLSGWASGNALSIIWVGDTTGGPGLLIATYDDSPSLAAMLDFDYA